MTVPRELALEFLRSRSADTMTHLNGPLLDHLIATEELLRAWGASEELCLAGLCHATYGTDGFAPFLLPWDQRHVLAEVAGRDVEETVYLYASCDRSRLYPQLSGEGPVRFRDRFRDTTFEPSATQLRDFVDLTLANELEIALGSDARRKAPPSARPAWIGPLVEQMEKRASTGVVRGARHLLGPVR
ncbi:MAG TPA: hypothetical protein VN791_04280 [Acidimicrobiales bacterium]|nr:hypothetical protein [Acidimicrobiales bacterium]